jgi:hypothetical protein
MSHCVEPYDHFTLLNTYLQAIIEHSSPPWSSSTRMASSAIRSKRVKTSSRGSPRVCPSSFIHQPTADLAVLDALAPHTSQGGAWIDIGNTATHYDLKAVYLETFARPLWGLTSLLVGGEVYEGTERWIRGLAAGTDPEGEEYWDGARAKDQRMVEMSPLSFAIAFKPDVFYDVSGLPTHPLPESTGDRGLGGTSRLTRQKQTDGAKKNIAAFLETCIGKPMPDSEPYPFRRSVCGPQ